MAELHIYRDNLEQARTIISCTPFYVGRAAFNSLQIPDLSVSRSQFAIEDSEEKWLLVDKSGKGTFVNGSRVDRVEISNGSEIQIGQWRAIFSLISPGFNSADDTTDQPRDKSKEPGNNIQIHISGMYEERIESFKPQQMTIGTAEDCDIVVKDKFVSAHHLTIQQRGPDLFLVTDQRSKNGTYIDRIRTWTSEVPLGCQIRIGNTSLVLRGSVQNGFYGMLGNSPAMLRLFETIERVAPSKSSVIITGETGTGKNLVANAIHSSSNKIKLVTVNCAALSHQSLESELFGHEKGALTTATKARGGAFEEANKGTIFLDKVDELPLYAQAKLLRVLDSGEVRRVGSSKRSSIVDVRVIVATNKDLKAAVSSGKFREDLYWRLCGVPLQTLPLRARKADLPVLIDHFITKNSPSPKNKPFFTDEAMKKLEDYDWPGNVRELGETVFRSILKRNGDSMDEETITFESPESHKSGIDLVDLEKILVVGKTHQDLEDEIFAKAYLRMEKNVQKAADALGISRQTVKRRLDALGLTTVDV